MKEQEIGNGINKEAFGKGKAGEKAFKLIEKEVGCEGEGCTKTATQTLDFYVFTGLEQIPLCDNCLPLVEKKVKTDLENQGYPSIFTTNGQTRA